MKGKFFVMENRIFEAGLDPFEFTIYAYLKMRADRRTKTCFPSVITMAQDCGISESKVRRVISSLEEKGLITRQNRFAKSQRGKIRQTSNLYHIQELPVVNNSTALPEEANLPVQQTGEEQYTKNNTQLTITTSTRG